MKGEKNAIYKITKGKVTVIPAIPKCPTSFPISNLAIMLYNAPAIIPATAGAENLNNNLDKLVDKNGFFCFAFIFMTIRVFDYRL